MNNAQVLFGGLLILLGLGFLFDVNIFEYLIPALLIFLGWQLLNGGRGKTETGVVEAERLSSEEINDVQIFTSENRVLESDAFEGGRYVVIFAGSTLDLREVKTVDENISLEVVALFGGGFWIFRLFSFFWALPMVWFCMWGGLKKGVGLASRHFQRMK